MHTHFRSCRISVVLSALTSHLNWATVQQYEPWGQAGEGEDERTEVVRCSSVHRSVLVCQRAGQRGVDPGTQIVTQSFVGNAFRRSATAAYQISTARGLCVLFAYCRNLRGRLTTVNTDYWLPVHWKLRIMASGKNFFILWPRDKSPPNFSGKILSYILRLIRENIQYMEYGS